MAVRIDRLKGVAASLPLLVLFATPGSALRMQTGAQPAAVSDLKATPEQTLARSIRFELFKSPPEASTEELEAFIVFVLSQQDYAPEMVETALDMVAVTPNLSDPMKQAIENVKAAYAKKKIKPGTAAINEGGRGFGGSFSSPGANIGGGSSNYS